jgi:hypothetical protein
VNFLIELCKLRHEFNLVSVSLSLCGNPALMCSSEFFFLNHGFWLLQVKERTTSSGYIKNLKDKTNPLWKGKKKEMKKIARAKRRQKQRELRKKMKKMMEGLTILITKKDFGGSIN